MAQINIKFLKKCENSYHHSVSAYITTAECLRIYRCVHTHDHLVVGFYYYDRFVEFGSFVLVDVLRPSQFFQPGRDIVLG